MNSLEPVYRIKVLRIVVSACLLAIFLALPSWALPPGREPTLGPLGGRNIYMPHLAWFSFPADKASTFRRGALIMRSAIYYANEFVSYPTTGLKTYRLAENGKLTPEDQAALTAMDYESTTWELGVDWQVGERVRFSLDWRLHLLYGGFLDAIIEGLHSAFNLNNAGRQYFSQNQVRWNITSKAGFDYSADGEQIAVGDLDFRSVFTLSEDRKFALAIGAAFKIPVGDRNLGFGSGYPDLAMALLLDWNPWKRWAFYTNMGFIFPLDGMAKTIVQIIPAVEFRVSREISFVLQMNFQTSAITNSNVSIHDVYGKADFFSLMQTNLKIGIKGRHGQFEWQFYLEEDAFTWEGTDVVFHFGVSFLMNNQ